MGLQPKGAHLVLWERRGVMHLPNKVKPGQVISIEEFMQILHHKSFIMINFQASLQLWLTDSWKYYLKQWLEVTRIRAKQDKADLINTWIAQNL